MHFLDIIQRNANRLLRLVGNLLLLSRIESGISLPELAPVSVPELARDAVRDASAAAASFGVTLKAATGDGPDVLGDHLGLTQVLENLIGNAVKFSHPGDTVRVCATWSQDQWRVDVADQGIGIPPDEMDRLFHRFVRASNARTSGRPGTGLGLSVVKAIVELHGGRVTVASELGQGTTFSIYLPGWPGPELPDEARVLIIEDDADIALSVQTVLSRNGFDVASSADGRQGLRDFHAVRPGPGRAGHRAAVAGRLGGAGAHPGHERRPGAAADRTWARGGQGPRAARRRRRLPDQAVRQLQAPRPGCTRCCGGHGPSASRPTRTTMAPC